MRFVAGIAVGLCLLPGEPARVASNDLPAAPDVHVVLRFAPHRLATAGLRNDVREQLAFGLISALEGIGRVQLHVLTPDRPQDALPQWSRAFADGLDRLDPADFRDAAKTHFVDVAFDNGLYRVRSRQVDGTLGWCSPVVRDEAASDRGLIARLALGQVLVDFGMTGTVAASDGDRTATVRLATGGLSDFAAGRWIQAGDVFAVVQTAGGGRTASPLPDTWLVAVAEPAGGRVECRIASRFRSPLQGWERGGFRAIKVGAASGPVRLRLVRPNHAPANGYSVRLSATGFAKTDAVRELRDAVGGRFESAEAYDRLAYARISGGDRAGAELFVPVPIFVDSPTTVVVRGDGADASSDLQDADVRACRGRLVELVARLDAERDTVNELVVRRNHNAIRERLNTALARADGDLTTLEGEVAALFARTPPPAASQLSELNRLIADAKALRQFLARLQANVARASEQAATPEARQLREALLRRVTAAERAADDANYDQAIGELEAVVRQAGTWPEVEKRLDELRQGWQIRSEAHAAARKFVYETWGRCDSLADFDRHLPELTRALAACRQAEDRFTPRKAYIGLTRALTFANRREAELLKSDAEDAARQLESLRTLKARIAGLLEQIERQIRPSG